jgi:rubrerythrin
MLLEAVLGRCRAFEARAAAVYRTFAARTRNDAAWCALWTDLAREEESHAAALTRASRWLDGADGWHTNLSGWDEALDEIEARLAEAESPDVGTDHDRQLLAALALERTELDPIYQRLTALTHAAGDTAPDRHAHVEPLVAAAERSTAPAVRLEAALLRARMMLEHG